MISFKINGQLACIYDADEISFEEVCLMAEMPKHSTVVYTRGDKEKPSGTLIKGQSVKIVKGMEFDCVPTGDA
jgi:hypothetical protein